MSLKETRGDLLERLERPRALRVFGVTGARRVVLGLFPSPLCAIDELLGLDVARAGYHGRGADALLRAIVGEYQTSRSDVWPAMLIVAFFPALKKLRRRVHTRFDEGDLDAAVIAAFLAGARSLRSIATVNRVPMLLRQEAKNRLFRVLGADRREAALLDELVPEAQARGRIEPFKGGRHEEEPHPVEAVALDDMIQELVAVFPNAGELLKANVRGLRELTAALRPDLSPLGQERFYQRVKKRRSRERARGDAASLAGWCLTLRDIANEERKQAP